jgi:hypothetical protein
LARAWLTASAIRQHWGREARRNGRSQKQTPAETDAATPPRRETEAALGCGTARWLLCDAVRALALGVLRGFDLVAALAAKDADEAADRVLLPVRRFDDLCERHAPRNMQVKSVAIVGGKPGLSAFGGLLRASDKIGSFLTCMSGETFPPDFLRAGQTATTLRVADHPLGVSPMRLRSPYLDHFPTATLPRD